jgi:hypothetical protein
MVLGLASLFSAVLFVMPTVAHAQQDVDSGYASIMSQGLIFANICPAANAPCECRDSGKCQLTDMIQIFVNISIAILAVSGSIALLMFFYGGFTWVTSMGNPKKIEEGKNIIVRAVIGLAIIFGSYALVNFVIAAISGQSPGGTLEETIDSATSGSGSGSNSLSCADVANACAAACDTRMNSCTGACNGDAFCEESCITQSDDCQAPCDNAYANCVQ